MSATSNAANTKTILGIGVKASQSYDAETIRKGMQGQLAEAKSFGFDVDSLMLDNNTTGDALAGPLLAKIHARQEKGQRWDGVLVGFGIRGDPMNSDMFEQAINICASEISPTPKFVFPLKPGDMAVAMKRAFETQY